MRIERLAIASGNRGKIAEFQEYLRDFAVELLPKPDDIDIEETGATFLENAHLKASQIAKAMGQWALADDSGLEVMALGGAPGIRSARYGASDRDRIARLLSELGNSVQRDAQFACAIAIAAPDGSIAVDALGICKGEITTEPRGSEGFGYDPIFYVPEYGKTFGEMTHDLKAKISHRARALEMLYPKLAVLL